MQDSKGFFYGHADYGQPEDRTRTGATIGAR
jgi:hypothetical protein